MGYITEFSGQFKFDRPVSTYLRDYINRFSDTRHMKRDTEYFIRTHTDNYAEYGFHGDLGDEGEYFTYLNCEDAYHDPTVLDVNWPPKAQPGLWCQWVITNDCTALEWDGAEKFYSYVAWLRYLINNFISHDGYCLNGDVIWQGEELDDRGIIHVVNNKVTTEFI